MPVSTSKPKSSSASAPTTPGDASPAAPPPSFPTARPSRRGNIFFTLAKLALYSCAVVPFLTSLLFIPLSTKAFNILGAILSHSCVADPAFNNLWRFLSVMWACYCPLLGFFASNIPRYAPLILLVASFVFMGGLVRIWTAWTYTIPGTPMGYFVFYISTFIDLTVPLYVSLLLYLGFRLEKKRA